MKISRRRLLAGFSCGVLTSQLPNLSLAESQDGMFDLVAGPSRQRLYLPDAPSSDLWTYNGSAPGPEIRVKKGGRVQVRFTNKLEEPTSVHWHGIRIDNSMDGVSGLTQKPVEPGDSFLYDFVTPDAGTFWYHAHNKSWNQVARGLYGPLIVDEVEPVFERSNDITLVLDDWRLAGEGVLDVASLGSMMEWAHGGRLGNWLTVNGRSRPVTDIVRGQTYRLRLINAANARVFEIDPNRFGATLIGFDGQSFTEPAKLDYAPLMLGPAQRVDLMVVAKSDFTIEEVSGDTPYPIAGFSVSDSETTEASRSDIKLQPNVLPSADLAKARRIRLQMTGGAMGGMIDIIYKGKKLQGDDFRTARQAWAFNGVANLAEEPFFEARQGETILIETVNRTAWVHAMHVHGHHFQILNRSGSDVDEGKPWRDTFLIGPDQTTEIAFVADNPGKWLFHCHMLEHAAAGMNTWFQVT
ncbi:multicopper oxidase [Hoeflea sp. BAL378]|uniref:multicopper oxidase family protein n=1 Tax=Hoeflea sp. BAL378 TaxID=1547437 RepID=UPI0005134C3E|nr:multicopper oxidase family protein [Hoeflea sp. BAL378]KGF67874.1 multicopper oxidase [Hoeflea sp. BAL378]